MSFQTANEVLRKPDAAPDTARVVRFPTRAAWQEYVRANPNVPNIAYCKYGCGGAGFYRHSVEFGHPLFGRVVTCQCAHEKAAQSDAERIASYRDELSNTEQEWSLDNWIGTDPNALRVARQAVAQKWGLFLFYGDVGIAKSGLLCGIVNQCLDEGTQARYEVATTMLDALRAGYEDESFTEQMNLLRGCKVLALDEMWRYKASEWAQEKIFQLLDWRYRHWDKLLTVVATNEKPVEGDPLWSRFSDARRGQIIHILGDDLRPFAK